MMNGKDLCSISGFRQREGLEGTSSRDASHASGNASLGGISELAGTTLMITSISRLQTIFCAAALFAFPAYVPMAGQPAQKGAVTLSPGDPIQAAVDSAAEGTTFVLRAGVYRMQSIQPKDRDIFRGDGRVILNGSQVLSFQPAPSPGGLWVANATANSNAHGRCQKTHPLCGYSQDLFIDNVLQTPVSSLQGLRPGLWYFDRSNNKVYIPANPAGHVAELGMQTYAFYGSASGVQIRDLTVEKYAAPAQYGAIGGNSSGTGWQVNNVESRWNHGRGISLGSGSQILNCHIDHNGQLGISLYGTNSQAIKNEISWNNYAGYDIGWEAGGSKFSNTKGLVVRSNYVHDNLGSGLWTDANNVDTLYENNIVVNNLNQGIAHEISYRATIRNNTVKDNGNTSTVWLWNAQIDIQNSSNVEVYGNIVEVPAGGGNGIVIINQKRGTGTLGPWIAANNHVHNNVVTYLGTKGASGIADDTGAHTAVGNSFDANRYIQKTGDNKHWLWFTGMTWEGLRAAGQETHGSCCN